MARLVVSGVVVIHAGRQQRASLGLVCAVLALAGAAFGQVDGPVQQAYLKASNPGPGDRFAIVSTWGDTVVVGAPEEDSGAEGVDGDQSDDASSEAGAAYVFVRTGTGFTQQAYLKPFRTSPGDGFGTSVSVWGDTIVVGAPGEDSDATGINGDGLNNDAPESGAAYVFVRNGTSWTPQAYIKASNTDSLDGFGFSVALAGDTLVVGALRESSAATGVGGHQGDNTAPYAGAAYVFTRSGTSWSQQAYLKASNTNANDQFGYAVATTDDLVVVGALYEGSLEPLSGAAYVFVRHGIVWTQEALLKPPVPFTFGKFGVSVAASGETVLVGAPGDSQVALDAGAAVVYVRDDGRWTPQAELKASNIDQGDAFGTRVALSGDTLVVGATYEQSGATGIDGDEDDDSVEYAGAAYVFVRDGHWTQVAYVKASNTDAGDVFGGSSVALSGDTLVCGARGESSSATGVDGDQSDNGTVHSGAAYLFDLGLDAWKSLDAGLAGTSAAPLLDGVGPLTSLSSNQLALSGALPLSAATLVVGLAPLGAPFKGGTMIPAPLLLVPLATNPSGKLTLPFSWPSGVPAGASLYFQFWISDPGAVAGFAASNGLKGVAG